MHNFQFSIFNYQLSIVNYQLFSYLCGDEKDLQYYFGIYGSDYTPGGSGVVNISFDTEWGAYIGNQLYAGDYYVWHGTHTALEGL